MRKLGFGLLVLIIAWAISMIGGCGSPTPIHTATDTPIAAPPPVTATPSPKPTRTPTPIDTLTAPPPATATATGTPTPSVPRAEVIVSALNVREGPGVDYPIIGVASAGDVFEIVDINPSGDWLKVVVTADGSLGWISGHPAYTRMLGSLDGVPVVQPPPPQVIATPSPMPTETPGPIMQVVEARVLYHDAVNDGEGGVGMYASRMTPWMDLLVHLDDGNWYGPERREDDIQALPLPDGYRWETDGGFSSMEDGGVWWNKTSTEGSARLLYRDSVLLALQLKIEFIDSSEGEGEGGGGGGINTPIAPPPPQPTPKPAS